MFKVVVIALVCFMLGPAVYAQHEKKAYINKVKELCPTADVVEVEIKDDYVEIEYWCENELIELGLNHQKEIIFTEKEAVIPPDVMRKIQQKLDQRYYGWVLDEYAQVTLPDTTFYKVELLKSGVEENIYFTIDGKYYKTKNVLVAENWGLENLEKYVHYQHAPYSFLKPYRVLNVPEILKEISGIAWAGENTLFCIQDETGIVFKFNIESETLTGMMRFTDLGDFEDIAVKGDSVYVLRSDGTVFYFNHVRFDGQYTQRLVPVSCMNVEGLSWNHSDQTFLIACKDQSISAQSSKRSVYTFTADKMHQPGLGFVIDLDAINAMLDKKYPGLTKSKIPFNPSAIAVHPLTNQQYVLSADHRLLAIFDGEKLIDLYPLPAEMYFKPEGLTFNENGELFIASEGIKKGYLDGQIFHFKQL